MRSKNKGFIVRLWILIIGIIACSFVYYVDCSIRPVVNKIIADKASTDAEELINIAVENVLVSNDINFQDLINITYNTDSSLKSITTDTVKMSVLRSKINQEIIKVINNYSESTVSIRVGSLLKNEFLNGKGPRIKFKFEMANNVESNYYDKLTSGGINQVKYQLMLKVQVDLYIITPISETNTRTLHQVLLNETLITGDVPDTYVDVGTVEAIGTK